MTVMRVPTVGIVASAFVVCLGLSVGAQNEKEFLNFRYWIGAVLAHQPGSGDDALNVVWKLSPNDQRYIGDHLATFVDGIVNVSASGNLASSNQILALARELAQTITAKDFLERAAVLHADAVMFDRRVPTVPAAPKPRQGMALVGSRSGGAVVMSSTDPATYAGSFAPPADPPFVTTVDGEITGRAAENWNWPFARLLVDQLRPGEADVFVSTWYHATAALLFKRGELAEVKAHLTHADHQLPHDAHVAFDRGCLAEGMGMNVIQQLAGEQVHLASAASSNAQALELFRQALALEPHFAEARVRVARLLELDGHFADANDQIQQALADKPSDTTTLFYAHLFGARAAAALGRDDDADAHVRAALDLFPSADSAILAASQAAFHRADAASAQSRLNELAGRPDVSDVNKPPVDPWREYMIGAGRALEPLLQDLWRAVPAREAR